MFVLNGQDTQVPESLQDARLLDFLRDYAGLKGSKFGCGIGACGACTVHIDGRAMRSCLVSTRAVAGKEVVTIEGLAATSSGDGLHPVQQAWIEEAVPQCGYCQAGQIMSAAALLSENAKPTDEEIEVAMDGNICRCGTYVRIRSAIRRVAATTPEGESE